MNRQAVIALAAVELVTSAAVGWLTYREANRPVTPAAPTPVIVHAVPASPTPAHPPIVPPVVAPAPIGIAPTPVAPKDAPVFTLSDRFGRIWSNADPAKLAAWVAHRNTWTPDLTWTEPPVPAK